MTVFGAEKCMPNLKFLFVTVLEKRRHITVKLEFTFSTHVGYIKKLFEKHTGLLLKHTHMLFLRKEVPVCFPGGQGSAGMPYRSIPSHFEA